MFGCIFDPHFIDKMARFNRAAMAGVFLVLILFAVCVISRGVTMDTPTARPVEDDRPEPVTQQRCTCKEPLFASLACYCPDIYSLTTGFNRVYVSRYLSQPIPGHPNITEFTLQCGQTSANFSTTLSGIFLPSLKTLTLFDCFRQHLLKGTFKGLVYIQKLSIANGPPVSDEEMDGDNVADVNTSSSPVELDSELFLPTPQLQTLTLYFLFLGRFPEALYKEVNGTRPLENLRTLILTGNRISHLKPEHLQHFSNLRYLDIQLNSIFNLSASFPFLPSLQVLNIPFTFIETLNGSPFQNITNLQYLDLSEQFSTNQQAAKYKIGNFGAGAMKAIFPTSFLGLSKLITLRMEVTSIQTIPNESFKDLAKLELLNISDGRIEHIGVSAFHGLGSLRTLDLSYNNLSSIHPLVFFGLSSLLSLSLEANALRFLPGRVFESVPNLSNLELGQNLITSLPTDIFKPLDSLISLDVHGNQLSTLGDLFSQIKSVFCDEIDVSYNNVENLNTSSLMPLALGIGGNAIFVDLSHNTLKNVYVTTSYLVGIKLSLILDLRWNEFTSLPLTLGNYGSFNQSMISIFNPSDGKRYGDISLLMAQNPLVCDCSLYELLTNLDVAKQGVLYTKTDFQAMECAYPEEFEGRRVTDLSPSELWCPSECYNRPYYCFCFKQAGALIKSRETWCETAEHASCPSTCSCSFQGKLHSSLAPWNELVDCARRNLSSFPADISHVTTILHIEGNQLKFINQDVFPTLLMIRELYLNDNNITRVGSLAFSNLTSLEILRLDGNNISEINSTAFNFLSSLRELYLNDSGIRRIEFGTFHNLSALKELHLENNRLQLLSENVFADLSSLRLLGIRGNPLKCSCDVLWFSHWLQSRKFLLSQGRVVSCMDSALGTRDVLTLTSAQLGCDDEQSAAQARNRLIIGLSITLGFVTIISVCLMVIFKRKEAIQVYLYARYGWRFREEEEDDEDKEYDAFLSYSKHDLDVVLQDVLPALENRDSPFRVCLHHRDFIPGDLIADNIIKAVSASKRTIILLSNNFLESDWCQLEFQAAHAQMLQDRANRVIVILLDDVAAEDAPPDIQHYLKTNTYLKWGDDHFWERLFYVMPRPRPRAQNEEPHAQNADGDQLALVEMDHCG